MAHVIQLAGNGITPALINASDTLRAEIWAAIDKATDAGVPSGLIVGQIEFIKAAIIDASFRRTEQEP